MNVIDIYIYIYDDVMEGRWRLGLASKAHILRLTHLSLSLAVSRSSLVGIYTGWPKGLLTLVLPED